MAGVRPIAMGIARWAMGATGDGVAGASLTDMPNPLKGAVTFNFADPKEVRVDVEGSQNPFFSKFVKDTTDYVELSIPSPDNDTVALVMGGTVDTTGEKDVWSEPVGVADINKTVEFETEVNNKTKVIYTIVNARIAAKISQAPTAEAPELLLIRCYKQAAISSSGVEGTAFKREVVVVS